MGRRPFARFGPLHGEDRLNVHGAFNALLLDTATQVVGLIDVAAVFNVVGMTASAAEELCPTAAAFGLVEDVHVPEEARQNRIGNTVFHIADAVLFLSDKLMARVNFTVRHDAHILVAGTAAAQALGNTGPSI